jgi:hypothetical protein
MEIPENTIKQKKITKCKVNKNNNIKLVGIQPLPEYPKFLPSFLDRYYEIKTPQFLSSLVLVLLFRIYAKTIYEIKFRFTV